ncbi:conserved protein of unknown function [Tenacibaculum sp. 190524A02b]|uniref:hypothetical protein n=1 Tax=Tenacibaculum vairaonense TaxID=3137860 RepID=UPI0032B2E85D
MARENEFEWNQFIKLGEMIGDGLHHEDPWITKEYKRLQAILLPEATAKEKEYKRKLRQNKNQKVNEMIKEKLLKDRCQCGAKLKQSRSGSKVVCCTKCDLKYQYKTVKQ